MGSKFYIFYQNYEKSKIANFSCVDQVLKLRTNIGYQFWLPCTNSCQILWPNFGYQIWVCIWLYIMGCYNELNQKIDQVSVMNLMIVLTQPHHFTCELYMSISRFKQLANLAYFVSSIDTLRPRKNRCYFTDYIFNFQVHFLDRKCLNSD